MRSNPQVVARLEPEERAAFDRAMRDGYRNVQQQARKYILEGLRRDGFLTAEQEPDARAERVA